MIFGFVVDLVISIAFFQFEDGFYSCIEEAGYF
jgi:hypothetical protein